MVNRVFNFIETYAYPVFVITLIIAVIGINFLPRETIDAIELLISK